MQPHFLEAYRKAVFAFLEQEKQRDDSNEPLDLFFHEGMQTWVEQELIPRYAQEILLLQSVEPDPAELYRHVVIIRTAAEKEYREWFKIHGFDYQHIPPSPNPSSTPTHLPFYTDPDGREYADALRVGQLVLTTTRNWDTTRTYRVSEPHASRWLVSGDQWNAKARNTTFKAAVYSALTHLNALTNWSLYCSSPKKVQRAIHVQTVHIVNEVSRTS